MSRFLWLLAHKTQKNIEQWATTEEHEALKASETKIGGKYLKTKDA